MQLYKTCRSSILGLFRHVVSLTDIKLNHCYAGLSSQRLLLQVADAVDDKHIDQWIDVAAEKLRQAVYVPTGTSEEDKTSIINGLLLLTAHLQQRVFKSAAVDTGWRLGMFFAFLPTSTHAAFLEAIITPEKTLRVPIIDALLPTVKALAGLPASPPSLLSLKFCEPHQRPPWQLAAWPDIAARLGEALYHHTGMTSLLLPSCAIIDASHELLFPAIAALTSLQSLSLEGMCALSTEHAAVLKQTFQALPHLNDLGLHLSVPVGTNSKRRRDGAAQAPPPRCLADMLSPATALTSLSLRTTRPESCPSSCFLTAATSLALPNLVQLTSLFGQEFSLAASFFKHLSAPLTSIMLSEGLQSPQCLPADAAPDAQQLLHNLAAFTQLRCFCVVLPMDEPDDTSVLSALTAALPSPFTAFSQLQDLTIAVEPALVHCTAPMMAAAAASLTQLCLSIGHPITFVDLTATRPVSSGWPEFFSALCSLKLQNLELRFEFHEEDRPTLDGISALQPLTALTSLHVSGWDCVYSPADWQALAGMSRLQQLCICHTGESFELPIGCMTSLRALSALTSLTLKTSEWDEGLVPILARHVPPQSLPALQLLGVTLGEPFEYTEALVAYAATLPALRQLTVHLLRPSYVEHLDDFEAEDFLNADAQASALLLNQLDEAVARLHRAASRAGVELLVVNEQIV